MAVVEPLIVEVMMCSESTPRPRRHSPGWVPRHEVAPVAEKVPEFGLGAKLIALRLLDSVEAAVPAIGLHPTAGVVALEAGLHSLHFSSVIDSGKSRNGNY